MMLFRADFLKIGNIDPLQCITIASECMSIYRSKYMPENTIGIIKDVSKNTCSKMSVQWLKYLPEMENVYIQHAMKVVNILFRQLGKSTGFVNKRIRFTNSKDVFWHGCPKCYTPDRINPVLQRDMIELQQTTAMKNIKIKELGYNLVEVYECEIQKNTEIDVRFQT